MFSAKHLVLALVIALAGSVLLADDLSGSDSFLCSVTQVTSCPLDEPCVTGSPWKENVPSFLVVDLKSKTLATTPASGLNRQSPIQHLERDNGLIILQGHELGRAFSFTISESTGLMTGAVALDGEAVVGFGACTPSPVN